MSSAAPAFSEPAPAPAVVAPGHWLGTYVPPSGSWDEVLDPRGEVRPAWREFAAATAQVSAADWGRRREEMARLLRDHGATYNVYSDARGAARPWQLDALPLLIARDEFEQVSAGLRQRARLLNAILDDVYGPQRLLHDGWLPPSIVLGNPGYLREACGAGGRAPRLAMLATDLARGPDGRWRVLADRAQAPSGKGYALENRTVLSRVWPGIFRDCGVRPLAEFFDIQREALRGWSPSQRGAPLVVLLTPGPFNETYFEHAFKARHLGFPLVEGADLTVRDRWVYLKTLEGLRRVDVIVRRVDDVFCDPLELRSDAWLGVAGLAEAWRAGHVALVNGLGSGVVETAALFPFLPGLCRRLLGEELLLPQVKTWWLGQRAEREAVLADGDRWVIKNAFVSQRNDPVFLAEADEAKKRDVLARVAAAPDFFVAQEPLSLSTAPTWHDGRLEARRLVWRSYVCATPDGHCVFPGGLTRVSRDVAGSNVTMQYGGLSKDTWVLGDVPEAGPAPRALPVVVRPARPAAGVPSRLADHLFWLGRYAERLEHVVRMVRAGLRRLAGEETGQQAAELEVVLHLLWHTRKLPRRRKEPARTPGEERAEELEEQAKPPLDRLRPLLADPAVPDAVPALAQRLRFNASAARDRLSDDMWRLINRLESLAAPADPDTVTPAALLDQLDTLILSLAALAGMEAENMTRGHGWRFLELGRRVERAVNVLELCRETARAHADLPAFLPPLLELCDSAMTYRRLYVAAPQLLPVMDLLIADETNPRSASFQLHWMARQSAQLPREVTSAGSAQEKEAADHLLSGLSSFSLQALAAVDPATAAHRVATVCHTLVHGLEGYSELVTAHYFNHALPKVR
jgi:uncharacterized circularly permuted ATP-grasp superfamily protein